MEAVKPTDWGAKVNYDTKTWRPWNPDKWVLHYAGGTQAYAYDGVEREMRYLRAYENFHVNTKGWLGIAYNYAIGMSGTLYRLRGENRSGATSGDYEKDGIPENEEARAVLFILGGNQEPTPEALNMFRFIYAGDPLPVIGHKDVNIHSGTGTSTTCPGPHIDQFIDEKGYEENMATPYETWNYKNTKFSDRDAFSFLREAASASRQALKIVEKLAANPTTALTEADFARIRADVEAELEEGLDVTVTIN